MNSENEKSNLVLNENRMYFAGNQKQVITTKAPQFSRVQQEFAYSLMEDDNPILATLIAFETEFGC